MSVTLAPPMFLQFMDPNNSGSPAVGFQLFTYAAGTSTKQATWTDSTQSVQWSNPIVLDANGAATVWGDPSIGYKFVLTSPNDSDPPTSPLRTVDNLYFPITASSGVPLQSYPQTPAEVAAGITPTSLQYIPGQPERYIAPGFTYASDTSGTGGTDFTLAINKALSIGQQTVILGPYLYAITSTIQCPNEQKMYGNGLNQTGLCCVSSGWASAHVITDTGSAAKIDLRGFTIYGNNVAADGINLGNNGTQFGTQGYLDGIQVDNVTGIGFNLNVNVCEMGYITTFHTAGIKILGSGSSVLQMENVASTGFNDVNGNSTMTELQDVIVTNYEIEAPATGKILVTIRGGTRIEGFWPSLSPSTTFTELVYIATAAENWRVNIPNIYFQGTGGTFPTFTNVFYDQVSATFFGAGSPSSGSTSLVGIGDYSFGQFIAGSMLAVKKQQLNAFTLRVTNPSGTIQHRIGAVGSSNTATNFATSVNAASATLQNTPTGTDASTAFAFGGKIGSATPSLFILDTGVEVTADSLMIANIIANSTTVAYSIVPFMSSVNVNGTTQNRLGLQLVNATTAAAVSWATALTAGGGVLIDVNVFGFFK